MKIAIIGASGFIGTAVTRELLDVTDHDLVLFSHRASLIQYGAVDERRLKHVDGSVLNLSDIKRALQGCQKAVYLVHLMGQSNRQSEFRDKEVAAAKNFIKAANEAGIKRVVYVGGMASQDEAPDAPGHLASRHNTGQILKTTHVQLIELRTPMVVGDGGAGFELLKKIVKSSPVLPLPKWVNGVTKPITVSDVARYVVAALQLKTSEHVSLAIGGPERLNYAQIAQRYAAKNNRKIHVLPVPFISQPLLSGMLRRLRSNAAALTVADMLASASYSTVDDDSAEKLFPNIAPESIDKAF